MLAGILLFDEMKCFAFSIITFWIILLLRNKSTQRPASGFRNGIISVKKRDYCQSLDKQRRSN